MTFTAECDDGHCGAHAGYGLGGSSTGNRDAPSSRGAFTADNHEAQRFWRQLSTGEAAASKVHH